MAFKRWSKTPSKKAPERSWYEDEMKMIGWCLNRKVKVSISPDWKDDLGRWQIDISINGKIYTDPERYESEDVYDKVLEYYKYYYKPNTNKNG